MQRVEGRRPERRKNDLQIPSGHSVEKRRALYTQTAQPSADGWRRTDRRHVPPHLHQSMTGGNSGYVAAHCVHSAAALNQSLKELQNHGQGTRDWIHLFLSAPISESLPTGIIHHPGRRTFGTKSSFNNLIRVTS